MKGHARGPDASAVKVFCYSDTPAQDEVTKYTAALVCDGWRDVTGRDDDEVFDQIGADEIDVLVDLTGHTARNRLALFSRQPAPVQMSYLGYGRTTGVPQIGWRITDGVCDPPGMTERFHSEKLLRVEGTFAAYTHLGELPPVVKRPAARFTFGAFARTEKISPSCVRLWAEALRAAADTRLVVTSHGFRSAEIAERFRKMFEAEGIDPRRVELRCATKPAGFLDAHNDIDVVLDTTPVNGHTTACAALLMGTPVLTLAGYSFPARLGATVLTAMAMTDWIADNAVEFASIAARAAAERGAVAALGAGLRERMFASPLCDGISLARQIEVLYLQAAARLI